MTTDRRMGSIGKILPITKKTQEQADEFSSIEAK